MKRVLLPMVCIFVLSLTVFSRVAAAGPKIVKTAEADLNGDGTVDRISISLAHKRDAFALRVNDAALRGSLEDVDGFAVVDIDQADKFKEIAIHTPGPSDDDRYLIYWYDAKGLHKMVELARWPIFAGNGIVYVDNWMGFWAMRDKYVMPTGARTLRKVPQEFYGVGVEAKVNKSFTLRRTRDDRAEIVANLRRGSQIELLVCDVAPKAYGDDWYLIRTETNLLGWAREKSFAEGLSGLPSAD